MSLICQETLKVGDVVCFGDIEDVLKNSCERLNSVGGTIIFTTINGSHFIPGEYKIFYMNKHTIIMCLEAVDPKKIYKYMLDTNCMNFSSPHLINRYDWKRCGESSPDELQEHLGEIGIQVETGVLSKLMNNIGDDYNKWTYIIKGDSKLNTIPSDRLILIKIEPQSENLPKYFYVMKDTKDNSVIGFVCKTVLMGDYEYGALLEDPTLGHFAFIYSDEHIYNSCNRTPEELPNSFTGLVNLKDFLN